MFSLIFSSSYALKDTQLHDKINSTYKLSVVSKFDDFENDTKIIFV